MNMTGFSTLACCGLLAVLAGCDQQAVVETKEADAKASPEAIVNAAIGAHGGYDKLKAASSWIAEIRRYQRGDSYVMRNYYRPGMVRLEQDLGGGKKSADVIGDPHCWSFPDPVSIPCSPETRENDRPRVIMERAVQLWPLTGKDWELLSARREKTADGSVDIVSARYIPRDSQVELHFDGDTHFVEKMSVDGVKDGVAGTHVHEYSNLQEYCGVKMPAHNVKSFEGETWVEEDILELKCEEVPETFFERPQQVADGHVLEKAVAAHALLCADSNDAAANNAGALFEAAQQQGLAMAGMPLTELGDSSVLCLPVSSPEDASQHPALSSYPAATQLSLYSLQPKEQAMASVPQALLGEAEKRQLQPIGPVRVVQYDNDGMGLTGELVMEFQLLVEGEE